MSSANCCPADAIFFTQVHINETSPYEVFSYEEDTVYFITDDGSEYLVGFIEETNIGIQRAYQLFIIKKETEYISVRM
ncbi:hypothetical protein [Phocaeicola dorei]|uniref:hypothetical protein n=1 Tax=Phocaeicola dorei TaxID=357276 RepID=UPI00215D47D2|nr:hypothetical protein [Phocaeicola dorei]